ncbi:MAG: hypothetical protein PWR03_777 [Tenuifilum sp.]|jgi:hypothetical protein|uniref:hypothetical protein n=1 Tax=Tenuifilum sp. TaxID=2760880 RepID=UPI0024AC1998|nr:hypothetical protein [Tenuifilum sp.]MDI3526594.1 hypothetical protein [Tenuifilum sp.]
MSKPFLYRLKKKALALALMLMLPFTLYAQLDDEDFYESILDTIVEVQNPVYKPVISLGAGYISFFGDVKEPIASPLYGNTAGKINISILVGKKHNFKTNIFSILGGISAHDPKLSYTMQQSPLPLDDLNNPVFVNSAFKTNLFQLGISLEYNFGHVFGSLKRFRPFVSLGFSTIFYSPKGNYTYNQTGRYYFFWSDGTMRDFPENSINAYRARIIRFDSDYETDLSSTDLFKQGSISQQTFSIPFDVGLDFYLSDRVNLRVGSAINYCFSDRIDNYDNNIAKAQGYPVQNDYNDIFMFTYFTMNFDLFSDPKTILVERVFAMLGENYDYDIFWSDQDNDKVFDNFDECPDTPEGVEVDSVGCPFDTDFDGVFDYMDNEPNTPEGAIVDDNGVQVSADVLAAMFNKKGEAVSRKQVKLIPVTHVWSRSLTITPGKIPEKLKPVDIDSDGYISFQELTNAINDFFDGKNNLTLNDLYDLNEYFFAQ